MNSRGPVKLQRPVLSHSAVVIGCATGGFAHKGRVNAMTEPAAAVLERLFRALEARDKQAALTCFTEDARLFDPHYPTPQMNGRAEIEAGLDWGLSVMREFGFTTIHLFEGRDAVSGAVEIDTNHVLKNGQALNFPQVFVFETRDGLISRLRAYEPYGPNGLGGLFLGFARLRRKLFG